MGLLDGGVEVAVQERLVQPELQLVHGVYAALDEKTCAYLKDLGAATASNGAVGLYHIENLTPEAKDYGETLIAENAKVYVINDAEIERVKNSYPCVWKKPDAKPKLCFIGCPHLTLEQLVDWTHRIEAKCVKKLSVPTVFTAAEKVIAEFEKLPECAVLKSYGAVLGSLCPLMYMNNPLCKKKPVFDELGDEFLNYVRDGMTVTVREDGVVEVG